MTCVHPFLEHCFQFHYSDYLIILVEVSFVSMSEKRIKVCAVCKELKELKISHLKCTLSSLHHQP